MYSGKPLIGVIPTYDPIDDVFRVCTLFLSSVQHAGGIPYILPLYDNLSAYESMLPMFDGFLLTGGQDVDPCLYRPTEDVDESARENAKSYGAYGSAVTAEGKIAQMSCSTPLRDKVEYLVLSYAFKFDVPVLGICRGMQSMNVFFGGTLYEDVANEFFGIAERTDLSDEERNAYRLRHLQTADYETPVHDVLLEEDSKLASILESQRISVNSMHHQAVRDVAPVLKATGHTEDGLTEAIELPNRTYIIGVQWHPEYFIGIEQGDRLFGSLVNVSAEKAKEDDWKQGAMHIRACEVPYRTDESGNYCRCPGWKCFAFDFDR